METLISGQFGNFCSAVSLTGSCNIKGCQIAQIWQLKDLFKLLIGYIAMHWFDSCFIIVTNDIIFEKGFAMDDYELVVLVSPYPAC